MNLTPKFEYSEGKLSGFVEGNLPRKLLMNSPDFNGLSGIVGVYQSVVLVRDIGESIPDYITTYLKKGNDVFRKVLSDLVWYDKANPNLIALLFPKDMRLIEYKPEENIFELMSNSLGRVQTFNLDETPDFYEKKVITLPEMSKLIETQDTSRLIGLKSHLKRNLEHYGWTREEMIIYLAVRELLKEIPYEILKSIYTQFEKIRIQP